MLYDVVDKGFREDLTDDPSVSLGVDQDCPVEFTGDWYGPSQTASFPYLAPWQGEMQGWAQWDPPYLHVLLSLLHTVSLAG